MRALCKLASTIPLCARESPALRGDLGDAGDAGAHAAARGRAEEDGGGEGRRGGARTRIRGVLNDVQSI